ncbi:alpha/beta-hydrolase [Schizophyllum commune H4-8]|uniref:alpha/beta-hydrolase n=1 Tax=Schizophyllum commune (strain H4-8 / FGSC 9210) TaxID=578458 RepID=UPI00215E64D6|nr:alpha/beta-hydrolase [Schizophyllum commune H4-8]KAI5894013.1 alpha/beta-hydrolase [Schizophyllum commune H4-8]
MFRVEDKRLALPDGRTLAYADAGNTSSSTVVLFLHDAFAVGDASKAPAALIEHHTHFVAPSLPGWGHTSPVPRATDYAATLARDMHALITHLHPDTPNLRIIICGHGHGSIPAQILYGAPEAEFPLCAAIARLVLVSPLAPPHGYREYAQHLSRGQYLLFGPPSRLLPWIPARIAQLTYAPRLRDPPRCEALVRSYLVDAALASDEHSVFERWCEKQEVRDGQLERDLAANAARSVARTWRGFRDMSAIYHSGWGGYAPDGGTQAKCGVIIVAAATDEWVPCQHAEWLAKKIEAASLITLNGSHLSVLFHMNDVWNEILRDELMLSETTHE